MVMEAVKRESAHVSGVTNVDYDLIALLHNKLAGIAALEEYQLDAQAAGNDQVRGLFKRLEQRAVEDVAELKRALAGHLE